MRSVEKFVNAVLALLFTSATGFGEISPIQPANWRSPARFLLLPLLRNMFVYSWAHALFPILIVVAGWWGWRVGGGAWGGGMRGYSVFLFNHPLQTGCLSNYQGFVCC
ncbi:hypothetical protein CDAR_186031 [Caerostris darwini]|uniref:Uncharacterized protein n=1 Tax=Caerostris darwini TaxID=1538125 RepID=A0AAV4WTT7_9ARAC|nr:hypothetical protein CDAR_186031 [Caerostris darwini]